MELYRGCSYYGKCSEIKDEGLCKEKKIQDVSCEWKGGKCIVNTAPDADTTPAINKTPAADTAQNENTAPNADTPKEEYRP